jgi:hypothetical protein
MEADRLSGPARASSTRTSGFLAASIRRTKHRPGRDRRSVDSMNAHDLGRREVVLPRRLHRPVGRDRAGARMAADRERDPFAGSRQHPEPVPVRAELVHHDRTA